MRLPYGVDRFRARAGANFTAVNSKIRIWRQTTLEQIAPDESITPSVIRQEVAMPMLDRNGVKIYYEVHGKGPPLLLTHGYSSTSAMWNGQVETLSKHH